MRRAVALFCALSVAAQDAEIALESTLGLSDIVVSKPIEVIDISGIDGEGRAAVCDKLWAAATDIGFFQVTNTKVPTETIDAVFATSADFFALPYEVKNASALVKQLNSGFESRGQVRPSTQMPDEKESYQMTPGKMAGRPELFPPEEALPGFRAALDALYDASHVVSLQLLSCFAERLGLDARTFDAALRPRDSDAQTTLRLLHYFPLGEAALESGLPRAGPHTDWTLVTLLYQRQGEDGLQACAGRDAAAGEVKWTPVPARGGGTITINVGDMLMRWSDDRLKSTVHRVTGPAPGQPAPDRYSVAYFAQANEKAIVEGPGGKYPPITAGDYILSRINSNFGGTKDKTAAAAAAAAAATVTDEL